MLVLTGTAVTVRWTPVYCLAITLALLAPRLRRHCVTMELILVVPCDVAHVLAARVKLGGIGRLVLATLLRSEVPLLIPGPRLI